MSDRYQFPDPEHAPSEGLIAVGGDLAAGRLLAAYRQGIFPWYQDDQPILWWSPDPRCVLWPRQVHISRSLAKVLRQRRFQVTMDRAFNEVISHCATTQRSQSEPGTWITDAMKTAYCRLHHQGYAHSVEVWRDADLVGGLYGVSLGRIFFGESMFSIVSNASKIALVALARQLDAWGFELIDCQVPNPHLVRMGAIEIPRRLFLERLRGSLDNDSRSGRWTLELPELSP